MGHPFRVCPEGLSGQAATSQAQRLRQLPKHLISYGGGRGGPGTGTPRCRRVGGGPCVAAAPDTGFRLRTHLSPPGPVGCRP